MKIETQKERFLTNWEISAPLFGTKKWEDDPNFLYFIEIPIETKLITEMEQVSKNLQKLIPVKRGIWIPPQRMHITLALPGRMGIHFQGNDINFMERQLEKITQEFIPFTIQLDDLNCFPDVLFREVYDERGDLQRLHTKISQKIPFAQNPAYQFENYLPHLSLFYGESNKKIIEIDNFDRNLMTSNMLVKKLFFGKARNDKGIYEKQIIREYNLER